MRKTAILLALLLGASAAQSQLPGLRKRGPAQPQQPVLEGIDALRADFAAQAGGTMVYYGAESVVLGAPLLAAGAARQSREVEPFMRFDQVDSDPAAAG